MTKLLAGAFLLLFSFAAAAQTPEDSVAFAGARWQITPLAAGNAVPETQTGQSR